MLHYAIADVGWFVRPGDALDVEAFERGVTVYLPDARSTLYPPVLSEGAASLLPDVDRPAVVFTVRVADDGSAQLDGVERAVVRNRPKLAYDAVTAADLPDGFAELHRRIELAEARRGAPRVEFPEQEVERVDGGGYELSFRPRLASEEQNAALSLATNLAVADALFAARHRAVPGDARCRRTPHAAAAPRGARARARRGRPDQALDAFERSLPRDDPRHVGVPARHPARRRRRVVRALPRRRAPVALGRGGDVRAGHRSAAPPAGPLRDRGDARGRQRAAGPRRVAAAFERLPAAMARAEQRANRAEREALDLAEAVVLSGREGDVFDAVVVDEGDVGRRDPDPRAGRAARVQARRVDPGDASARCGSTRVDVDRRRVAHLSSA